MPKKVRQSLLMQTSPGRSHIHQPQKYFFHETSSLLSVLDPREPTDLSQLTSPSTRDVALAVLELETHHLHFYLFRSGVRHRHQQHLHPASAVFPLQRFVHWWFLHKGYTALETTVQEKPVLFLAILPSYALGWKPGCAALIILRP